MRQLFILIISIIFYLQSVTAFASTVQKGVLDLSSFNWGKEQLVNLEGEWEFYWRQLLSPQDFEKQYVVPNAYFANPDVWNDKVVNGDTLTGRGYATYRLMIDLGEKYPNKLGFKIPSISTAYKVYINGKLYTECGIVSENAEEGVARYYPTVVLFETDEPLIELIIQVSNYAHRKGGIWEQIVFGEQQAVVHKREIAVIRDMFLAGSLLMMALYHLSLVSFRKKERGALIFAICCFVMFFRVIGVGEYIITALFPYINHLWVMRVEYLSYTGMFLLFPLFIRQVYPNEFSKYVTYALAAFVAIFWVIILFFDTYVFSHVVLFTQYFLIPISIYCIVALVLAVVRKREGAVPFLIGVLIVVFTTINDTLYQQHIINSVDLFVIGFFIFIFCQSVVLSYRFSYAFNRSQQLADTLNKYNKSLESVVSERTEALQVANNELNTQKEALERKSSEITSSINYAQRIQSAVSPSEEKINTILKKENIFILNKPKAIVSGDFYFVEEVDNKIVIAVVDCTGHGVPGAFMSLIGRQQLADIVLKQKVLSPNKILDELRVGVFDILNQEVSGNKDGMDIAVCVVDKQTKLVEFAGAKNPLVYVQDGRVNLIKGDRTSIGGSYDDGKDKEYTLHTVDASWKDTTLYLYSDGYQDQFGGVKKQKFLAKRFRRLLESVASLPMVEQEKYLTSEIEEWMQVGKEPQTDDMLVIGVKI